MNVYITYNDSPSGIYKSQVIDVIEYLNTLNDEKILLIAFVSLRGFQSNKRKIKSWYLNTIVVPSVPGINNWRKNQFILRLFVKRKNINKVICRGVFATHLALYLKNVGVVKKVIFDVRGAYAAEWEEFGFGATDSFVQNVAQLEKEALLKSDLLLAVSNAMLKYWNERHQITPEKDQYVVIPCTLNSIFFQSNTYDQKIMSLKKQIGISEDKTVLIYSGSTAGWQSIDSWLKVFTSIFEKNESLYFIFLTSESTAVDAFVKQFPNRSLRIFISPEEVPAYLSIADFGILIRENYVTNQVASPVKFAEYLSVGLEVIISKNIGDFGDLVVDNELGIAVNELEELRSNTFIRRKSKEDISEYSKAYFSKNNFKEEYKKLLF